MGPVLLYCRNMAIDLDSMIEDVVSLGYGTEYANFYRTVAQLSLTELKRLSRQVGVAFRSDDERKLTKDELLDVIDECNWRTFVTAYREVAGKIYPYFLGHDNL